MMKPYIDYDSFVNLLTRVKYTSKPLKACVDKLDFPEKPRPTVRSHPKDALANHLGMQKDELLCIEQILPEDLLSNDLVLSKYREFIMAVKLTMPGDLSTKMQAVRNKRTTDYEAWLKSNSSYQHKIKERERKVAHLTENWNSVKTTVFTRWNRMVKSLDVLISRRLPLGDVATTDSAIIYYLADLYPNYVEIENDVVTTFDRISLMSFTHEEITEVILHIEENILEEIKNLKYSD